MTLETKAEGHAHWKAQAPRVQLHGRSSERDCSAPHMKGMLRGKQNNWKKDEWESGPSLTVTKTSATPPAASLCFAPYKWHSSLQKCFVLMDDHICLVSVLLFLFLLMTEKSLLFVWIYFLLLIFFFIRQSWEDWGFFFVNFFFSLAYSDWLP